MRRSLAIAIPLLIAFTAGCKRSNDVPARELTVRPGERGSGSRTADRARMVSEQLVARDISDQHVLRAMREVPRHRFVPKKARHLAYGDRPVRIGYDQTISQPYIVAKMTELAKVAKGSRVLEIGTGSGYQAAVLAALGAEVYSIEIVKPLGLRAQRDLKRLGYAVNVRIGDGYQGWPDKAPFDAVIVTAAPPKVPKRLKEQLKVGGRLVIPVGGRHQELLVVIRKPDGFEERSVFGVLFVPMTGEVQRK